MKVEERKEARSLRLQGWSIKRIARKVGVAVATVSVWVRDINLSEEQMLLLEERQKQNRRCLLHRGRLLQERAEIVHAQARRAGSAQAESDEQFRLICAIYWGEGLKAERSKRFAVFNADPRLLSIVLRWLVGSGYGDKIRFRVQYYPDNGLTEDEIKHWWLRNLKGLEAHHCANFSQQSVSRASQQKNRGKLPFGTATVGVNSVELYYKVMGGIDYLASMGT